MAERVTINQLAERMDTGFQIVKDSINELKDNQNNFSRNDILDLKFKDLDAKLLELASRDKELELLISKMRQRNSIQVWVTGTLSACFGVLLTFLVTYFLQNIGK